MLRPAIQRALLVGLAFALGVGPAAAVNGTSVATDQRYHVLRWTTDQGLPQNRISCLKQTRDGYLWLGTWFGLARFDGVRFTVFDKSNTPELAEDTINDLAEDRDGTLWIATLGGLVHYREHLFQRLTAAEGLPRPEIYRVLLCQAGGLWLQVGRDTVARVEAGQVSRVWKLEVSSEG